MNKADSIRMREEQLAKDKATAAKQKENMDREHARIKAQNEEQSRRAREHEIATLEEYNARLTEPDARQMIFERIKKLREEKPPEIKPLGRTPLQEEQFNAEQAAGRAAVAKMQAEEDRNRAIRDKVKAEDEKRLGTMTSVHRSESKKDQSPSHWPGRK